MKNKPEKPGKKLREKSVKKPAEKTVEKKEKLEKPEKILGKTSYKNSKQKQKVQQKKRAEDKKIINKDRQIKVKIKHLQKELARINKNPDPKNNAEKLIIEKKIAQLSLLNKNFNKKPAEPKKPQEK